MTTPATRVARHAAIAALLDPDSATFTDVASQAALGDLLADRGFTVTQATLSRDLVELRAQKVRRPGGETVYTVPGERVEAAEPATAEHVTDKLARLCADLLVTAEASGNLVVLRTPPGAAHFLASAIDHSVFPAILGTIAGDDTVLVITRSPDDGEAVATRFLDLASTT